MAKIQLSDELIRIASEAETVLKPEFDKADEVCSYNSKKVLDAFLENRVSYSDFQEINGYAFFDESRDKIERIFASVLGSEDAFVRPQIMSGTNAIYITLSGLLNHGDTMLCVTGTPYDPLQEIMGIRGNSPQSLKNRGVKYEQIELVNEDFDYEKIRERIAEGGIKLVEIQRSCGYSDRRGITVGQIEKLCGIIKSVDESVIIMCDNCYGELVEKREPTDVGADVIAGSLMHNLGGGIATSGGYIAGKKEIIDILSDRLTSPGMGKYLGANYNQNLKILKGLFLAPNTVRNAVKTAIFTAYMAKTLGYEGVKPDYGGYRSDTVQTFNLKSAEEMVLFCTGMQSASPVDSHFTPVPCEMPGYPHDEIMSAGTFSQGSTIELTCDGPVVEPYKIFVQGGLTYEYGKLGVLCAFDRVLKNMR